MTLLELEPAGVLALANYLDKARRRDPEPATPALAGALETINRAAVEILAAERPALPNGHPVLFGAD